jgi:hypothetical protein
MSRHFVWSLLRAVAANRISGYIHGFNDRSMAMLPILEKYATECSNVDTRKAIKEVH